MDYEIVIESAKQFRTTLRMFDLPVDVENAFDVFMDMASYSFIDDDRMVTLVLGPVWGMQLLTECEA